MINIAFLSLRTAFRLLPLLTAILKQEISLTAQFYSYSLNPEDYSESGKNHVHIIHLPVCPSYIPTPARDTLSWAHPLSCTKHRNVPVNQLQEYLPD